MIDQSCTSYYCGITPPWEEEDSEEREGICCLSIPIPVPEWVARMEAKNHNEWKTARESMEFKDFQEWAELRRNDENHQKIRDTIDSVVDRMICRIFGFEYNDDPKLDVGDRCDWRSDLEKVLHGEYVDSYFYMSMPSWELLDDARTYMIYIDCPCTIWGAAEVDYDEDGPYECGFEIESDDALSNVPENVLKLLDMLGTENEVRERD